MITIKLCALLCLFALCQVAGQQVYGVTFGPGDDNTVSNVVIVEVAADGTFTPVTTIFVYVENTYNPWNGMSAFDETKNIFYYASDFQSAFVYSVDVVKGALLPPLSISADQITQIVVDTTNDQLLVIGSYPNNTYYLVAYPNGNGHAGIVANFSIPNLDYPLNAALDDENGIFYFFYVDDQSDVNFAYFSLDAPENYTTLGRNPCKGGDPNSMAFDSKSGSIVGYQISDYYTYSYYQIKDGQCEEHQLSDEVVILCGFWEPVEGTLYFNFENYTANYLGMFTPSSGKYTVTALTSGLVDIAVSYKS